MEANGSATLGGSLIPVSFILGLSVDVTFEAGLDALLDGRCITRGFDPGASALLYNRMPKGFVYKQKIGAVTNGPKNEASLPDLMDKFNETHIDILKIDIEGSEMNAVPQLLDRARPTTIYSEIFACQVLIEIHDDVSPSAAKWKGLLRRFEESGFWIFSLEQNPRCPHCLEVGYIHESCRRVFGVGERYLENFSAGSSKNRVLAVAKTARKHKSF